MPGFFFFQAEDGIRDGHVTGVQTCALPIFTVGLGGAPGSASLAFPGGNGGDTLIPEILDASGNVLALAHGGSGGLFTPCGPLPTGGSGGEIGRASCRERGGSAGCAGPGRWM